MRALARDMGVDNFRSEKRAHGRRVPGRYNAQLGSAAACVGHRFRETGNGALLRRRVAEAGLDLKAAAPDGCPVDPVGPHTTLCYIVPCQLAVLFCLLICPVCSLKW